MRTGVHLVEESAQVPECFDSFEEYRGFLLEHRELLSRIVKLTAALLPEQALQVSPCLLSSPWNSLRTIVLACRLIFQWRAGFSPCPLQFVCHACKLTGRGDIPLK